MSREKFEENMNKWMEFLTPEILRPKLISTSIYIAAFELLKSSIIDHPRNFFSHGFDQNGAIVSPKYQAEILDRDRSPVRASLLWLRQQKAIDSADIEIFDELRKARNKVTHGMHVFATGGIDSGYLAEFPKFTGLAAQN
jgi:hypothetical protein